MPRWFNVAGPCIAREHYMLPPERRVGAMMELLEEGRWFSLVSGRQTGKTTTVQWIAEHDRAEGVRATVVVDLQTAREKADVGVAMRVVLDELARWLASSAPELALPDSERVAGWLEIPDTALSHYLRFVCAASARPLVLLFDEADSLVGAAMVSFLTQLRELYIHRATFPAPRAVALVGARAVRDYTVSAAERSVVAWLGTASPFNITVEDVGLAPFTEAEVGSLAQHTAETGQSFEADAVALVWTLSQGHPWLVNALADHAVRRGVRDRGVAVTAEHIEHAKEAIILERRTHIDSLLARLREPRVRRVIDPMIAGQLWPADSVHDDVAYVAGLGLIRVVEGQYEVANPIYREVIPRVLTFEVQHSIGEKTAWYVGTDGMLDVQKLMAAWQTFWRKDGHLAADGFSYKESGPHLMLMAWLQRVVNGGGRIEREYGLGKGAVDLLIAWKEQRIAIEVKLRRESETENEALEQVRRYLGVLGVAEGWLVMFDLRSTTAWGERLFVRDRAVDECVVHIVGC